MKDSLYELPFDQFQRYRVVQEIVDFARLDRPLKILDVGGYPGLISDFLPDDETLALDVVSCNKPNYIQGDGTSLPFVDKSFDVVVSLDVYEHIPPERRDLFIDELCRVSQDLIIISAPFKDKEVEMAEQILYDYVVRVFGEFPTLKQHLDLGLPEMERLLARFKAKNTLAVHFPSGHLYNWLIMMLVKHYVTAVLNSEKIQMEIDKLYNLKFSSQDYKSPSYRQVVVASQNRGDQFLKELTRKFQPSQASSEELSHKLQFFQMLIDLLNLQMSQQITAKEAHIGSLENTIRKLEQEIKTKNREIHQLLKQTLEMEEKIRLDQQHIANLEGFVGRVKDSLAYKIYRLFRPLRGSSGIQSGEGKSSGVLKP